MKIFKLGTRNSPLALWQANHVKNILESKGLKIEIKEVLTKGDKILNMPLSKIGGKGLFTRELESSLLNQEIDFAVHSLKDVPVILDENLELIAITKRANPADYFVSLKFKDIHSLPLNAKVGTTSLRRSVQLKHFRKDLDSINLRGNIQTRLNKLESNLYDAIIMAGAAIDRLDLTLKNMHPFDFNIMLPAMGQGALGIECRKNENSSSLIEILKSLNDEKSSICCTMERHLIRELDGGCQSPIAVYAEFVDGDNIRFRCSVGDLGGNTIIKKDIITTSNNYIKDVNKLVEELRNEGIQDILDSIKLDI